MFPSSICVSCRLSLEEYEKGVFKRPKTIMPNYMDIVLPKNTRQNDNIDCCDYICTKARYKGHVKLRKGVGHKRSFENRVILSTQNNISPNLNCEQPDKILKEKTKSVDSTTRCSVCWQEVSRGINNSCIANGNTAFKNVVNIVQQLPQRQQDRILSRLIRNRTSVEDKNKKII